MGHPYPFWTTRPLEGVEQDPGNASVLFTHTAIQRLRCFFLEDFRGLLRRLRKENAAFAISKSAEQAARVSPLPA